MSLQNPMNKHIKPIETILERKSRLYMTCSVYRYLRQNIRPIATLLPLVVLTLCISLVAYQGDGTVLASQLFQSPVEPEEEVPPEPPPQAPPEQPPQEKPKPEKVLPPAGQRPTPVPIPSPTSPPPQPQPAEQAAPVEPPVPDQPPPDQQPPLQAPTPAPAAPPPPAEVELVQSEMVIDSGLLIDSVLVYISYAWLCCGVIAFVMIPVVFLVLYVLGVKRSRNANE